MLFCSGCKTFFLCLLLILPFILEWLEFIANVYISESFLLLLQVYLIVVVNASAAATIRCLCPFVWLISPQVARSGTSTYNKRRFKPFHKHDAINDNVLHKHLYTHTYKHTYINTWKYIYKCIEFNILKVLHSGHIALQNKRDLKLLNIKL